MALVVVGAPVDCIGADPETLAPFGTELSPRALRELGVVERVGGVDGGDLDVRVVGRDRDPRTGLVGGGTVHETVSGVRAGVRELLAPDERVLLVGGCCIPLMGALAGARDARGEVGLVYVDGHLDLYDHRTSPTGEAADMPTAAVLGMGESGLLAAIDAPVVTPDRVAVLGAHDPDEWPAVGHLVDAMKLHVVKPPAITTDPQAVARAAADRAGSGGAFWLHLDVDVFDQEAFPATDYLMPNGLGLDAGHELLQTLGADDRLIGVSVGCYNPEKDPGQQHGRVLVDLLAAAVGRP
jgi:arginase